LHCGNVLGFESDDIPTKPIAVDGEIEQRRVALAVCELKFGADRPGARTFENVIDIVRGAATTGLSRPNCCAKSKRRGDAATSHTVIE
jgi:hypothetical protein